MSALKLTLVGLGSRLTLMGINIVNVALLARFLEPVGRGEYFLFQTMVVVLMGLSDLGLSQSFNVFSGQHGATVVRIHAILLRLLLFCWGCASLLGGGVLWLIGESLLPGFPQQWLWITFAVLPITLYANFWNGMMIGFGRIWGLNAVQLVMGPVHLVLILLFVVSRSGGVLAAIAVYAIMLLIQFLIMVGMVWYLSRGHILNQSLEPLTRQMLSFGLRGYLNAISSLLWIRIPIFLLNVFHGPVAVGIFAVAQQLAEKILLPVQALQDAIYRKMSTLSRLTATLAMNRYLRLTIFGLQIVVLVGTAVSPAVISVLFGNAYAWAAPVLRVLLVGTAFTGAAMIASTYILCQLRRPGLLSVLAVLNVIVSFCLGLLFVPRFGELGTAWALVLTQVIGTAVVIAYYLRFAPARLPEMIVMNGQDLKALAGQIGGIIWRKKASA